MIKHIRGGMGLGDALYVQSVARHLVKKGDRLVVRSAWPDVFRPLGDKVRVVPFSRVGVHILAHYASRKGLAGTTQFEDCCINAGITEKVDLRLDWTPANKELIATVKASGKPIVCVQLPRSPMGRIDGFGAELLPDCRVIQAVIEQLKDRALIIQIGSGKALFEFAGIDIDLANRTCVSDLIDLAWCADAFLGYCSFVIPLAESLDKPAMLVWSKKGLNSGTEYVRRITPSKVLHKPSCRFVIDDASPQEVRKVADALLQ